MNNANGIKKIKKISVSDQVFDALREKLIHYEWVPGDKLPAENDLAESFGVSRLSVRAAIQKLAALGMVETKNGGGTYVRKFQLSSIADNISGMLCNNISIKDISEFRELVETRALSMLSDKKLMKSDLKYLENCCSVMERAARVQDWERFARADYDFHRQICKMSGNSMFVYAYELIGPVLVKYFYCYYDSSNPQSDGKGSLRSPAEASLYTVREHIDIVEAIKSANLPKAIMIIRSMTTHYPQNTSEK